MQLELDPACREDAFAMIARAVGEAGRSHPIRHEAVEVAVGRDQRVSRP